MKEFVENLKLALETTKTFNPNELLSEIGEWDSLAVVIFIAMADLKYKKTIKQDDIMGAKTIYDLYELIQ
jgi:acyl carrier protein